MGSHRRWDFFISHAGADLSAARKLYDLLKPRARTFLDERCLLPGDDWDVQLATEQRSSAVTVVLVSSRTEAAYYQREEVAAAIALARESPTSHRVVPVYLDSTAEKTVPFGLRLKHGISLPKEKRWNAVVDRLILLMDTIREQEQDEQATSADPASGVGLPVSFELEGRQSYDYSQRLESHRVNDALVGFAGRGHIRLVKWDLKPYRIRIQASTEIFRKIHSSYLSGELDKVTGIVWESVSLYGGPQAVEEPPSQTPVSFCEKYDEDQGSRSVVCHLACITGFERECTNALTFVGTDTRTPADCRVYVTRKDGFVYAHSNYVKPGYAQPTKLATNGRLSLFKILLNLMLLKLPDEEEYRRLRQLHEQRIHFFVNESAYPKGTDPGFFCGAINIKFVKT